MRAVLQRVTSAKVTANKTHEASIGQGLMVLLGISQSDTTEDLDWLLNKIINMRIFNDEAAVMNKSVMDVAGEMLVVSQFTLYAQTKKGNRPGFTRAARPETAIPLYEFMKSELEKQTTTAVETGIFGADMKISLLNDGPVTIVMDTKNKE